MDVREKLVELLDIIIQPGQKTLGDIADYLISNGVTVQEWISVKDRLPVNDQKVLCFNYNGEYKVLRWNYIDWMWNSGIEWRKEDYVLYWMPLPQPPKGE